MAAAKKAQVTAQSLRIRSGPGTTFGIITTVPQGTMLDFVEQQGDWIKIRFNNTDGFVASQFVEIKTENTPTGFLIEQPALMEVQLVPGKIIPTDGLAGAELAVANTWNNFGNLMDTLSNMLNVPVGALIAVLVAESSGRVFAADGRMIIRFENHLFYRFWGMKNQDTYNNFFRHDTSSPKNNWKSHQWRPNLESEWQSFHGTQAKEWNVLAFARALDDTAALSSISMGAPQTMGFNYKLLGYESVQHMFDSFSRSAHAQLLGMFDFVKGPKSTSPAIQALQAKDYLTFASIYNGSGNAETYRGIIQARADMYDKLIAKAVTASPPATEQRGPVDQPSSTPAPTPPAPVVPAPAPIPAPAPTPIVEVPPAPPANEAPVFVATLDGMNVRSEPKVANNVVENLRKNEPVTVLEPLKDALDKMAQGEKGKQWIKIRTDEGREAYAAAWLLAPSDALVKQTTDEYIDSIPDQYPIPAEYDMLWSMQDRIGLPDPFSSLPVQIRTPHKLVNMMVNGFGPNSFSARNWRNFYSRIGGMHNGHDFIVETGTPLLAVADGIVTTKWPFMANKFEKTVTLWPFLPERFKDAQGRRMMSNIIVAYAHLSDNTIKKEFDVVKAGEVIGISGTPAGTTSNDHLHMEVHVLSGDTGFLNLRKLPPRQLFAPFKRAQPTSNQMPWNTVPFYNKRLIRYLLHQSKSIGYFGGPSYPSEPTLKAMSAGHLPAMDEFTLAAFEYGIPVVWEKRNPPWPKGVVSMQMLPERLNGFTQFEPYEATFLK
jgi:murein DD-endopeptidase MepM/ murein hydrolase activator NlpD